MLAGVTCPMWVVSSGSRACTSRSLAYQSRSVLTAKLCRRLCGRGRLLGERSSSPAARDETHEHQADALVEQAGAVAREEERVHRGRGQTRSRSSA